MNHKLTQVLILLFLISCQEPEILLPDGFIDESFWVSVEGAHLYTSARGNATTGAIIIHVHGGPALGSHSYYYERSLSYKAMEEEAIVVYYDQRGIGLSTGNFSKDKYSIEQFVVDLDQVVDVVSLKYGKDKNIFLFGRSWGGKLTTHYLLDDQKQAKITGWISTNGAHDIPLIRSTGKQLLIDVAEEQISLDNSIEEWKRIKDFAENFNPNDASAHNQSDYGIHAYEGMNLLKKDYQIQEQNEVTWLSGDEKYRNTALVPNETIWNDLQDIAGIIYNQLLTISIQDQVHLIKLPILMTYGEYDLICPPKMGKMIFDLTSTPTAHKQFIIYKKIGHSSIDAPDRYVEHFKEFINKYNL